jgi:hypothetical protein
MQLAVLKRLEFHSKQTLGHFTLFDGADDLMSAKSLELPDLNNQTDISCIPVGEYLCKKRFSDDYGWHYLVEETSGGHVTGRKWVLIHFGNFYHNTRGCILLGRAITDLNGDGLRDVTSSVITMNLLNSLADDVFKLIIC